MEYAPSGLPVEIHRAADPLDDNSARGVEAQAGVRPDVRPATNRRPAAVEPTTLSRGTVNRSASTSDKATKPSLLLAGDEGADERLIRTFATLAADEPQQ